MTESTPFFPDSPDMGAEGTLDSALDSALDAPDDADSPDGTDEGYDEVAASSLDAGDSPEPTATVPPEVAAELNALRAQRDQVDQYQRQVQQQQAEQYWTQQWQGIQSAYANGERQIYEEAQKAYDPTAFVRERMGALNAWRNQQTSSYYQQREQSVWQFAAKQAVPGYARKVAEHYRLDDTDLQRLMKFPPDMMPQVAEELRTIRQEKRSAAAAKRASGNPGPGSGPGRSQRRQPRSLDDLVDSLFAGR